MTIYSKTTGKKRSHAEIHGDFIYVYTPYSKDLVEDCRQITGRRWDHRLKANIFPLSSVDEVAKLAVKWNIELPPTISTKTTDRTFTDSLYVFNIFQLDEELIICLNYDPAIVMALKNIIPGAKWDNDKRFWRVPLKELVNVLRLADRYDLSISYDVSEMAKELREHTESMRAASSALDADIEIPEIAIPLLPYQRAGVSYIQKVKKAILADQPGLGKTVQALSTLVAGKSLPAVVVCPNTLKLNWEREVRRFFPHLKSAVLNGTRPAGIEEVDIIIINYDILHHRLDDIFKHGYRSLIADESHAIKNGQKSHACPNCDAVMRSNSTRCGGCMEKVKPVEKWSVKRTDAVMKLAKNVSDEDYVILLTGTPVTNRPLELIPQLEAINKLDYFGGSWKFKNRYAPKKNVALNTLELNEKLRESCFVRRLKKDVYGELPELRNSVQLVSPSEEQMRYYRSIELDAIEWFAEKARRIAEEEGYDGTEAYWQKRIRLEASEDLVRLTALREAVSTIKHDSVIAWLDNFLESSDDEKVIVFAEHVSFVEQIYERYKDTAVKIRGGVSITDRQKAVDRFQNDPTCRIFVGNMQAASEGLTLTAASDVVFCELGWTPAIHEQCVSRCYGRANDMHGATAWYLLAPRTIDEYIYELLEKKKRIVDAVTDGIDSVESSSIIGDLAVMLAEKGLESGN